MHRTAVPEPPQQQWKTGPGLVFGQENRHFSPREARARPEREAEPPHGQLSVQSPAPHRRRQQGHGLRKERAAPYEQRSALGAHGLVMCGGVARGIEAAGGLLTGTTGVSVCNPPPVCGSVYADQLIDYYTGKICPRRFCIAYSEVSKLMRLSEAPPTSPGSVFPPIASARGGGGVTGVDRMMFDMPSPNGTVNGTVPQGTAVEADEMSEVSQVEEGEVDEDAPGIQVTNPNSSGQLGNLRATPPQPTAVCTAPISQAFPVSETAQLGVQGVSSPATSFPQQQIAGSNGVRRDPRLAARARAETAGQYAAPPAQEPESTLPERQREQHESPQQQEALQWDPSVLPPALRRQPLLSGKLPLLLDLDNTLLHAQAVGVAGYHIALEDWLDEDGLPEVYKFELPYNRKVYYLKLRPGLRRFLKTLAPFFELSIYTNATQEYADLVVAILDPDRSLFSDR